MGLLPDYLFDNSTTDGGGLLPWLSTTIANLQQGGSPMLTGQPYGRFPMQPDAPSASVMQPPPAPAQADAPPARQAGGTMPSALGSLPLPFMPSLAGAGAGSPSLGDRLGAGLMGFAQSEAPLPAFGNLISGLITGKRADPQGVALQAQGQAQRAAAQYVTGAQDIEPNLKAAMIANPALAVAYLSARAKPPAYGLRGRNNFYSRFNR